MILTKLSKLYHLQCDCLVTVAKLVGFHAHFLGHEEEQVAHVSIGINRAAADPIMIPGVIEGVAVKVTLVEIKVASVPQAEVRTTGEHQRQVGVAVAVTIGHAASEE